MCDSLRQLFSCIGALYMLFHWLSLVYSDIVYTKIEFGWDKILTRLSHTMGLLRFSLHLWKYYLVYIWKRSSFWPSADVKPVSDDLVHAMQCPGSACLLFQCIYCNCVVLVNRKSFSTLCSAFSLNLLCGLDTKLLENLMVILLHYGFIKIFIALI